MGNSVITKVKGVHCMKISNDTQTTICSIAISAASMRWMGCSRGNIGRTCSCLDKIFIEGEQVK